MKKNHKMTARGTFSKFCLLRLLPVQATCFKRPPEIDTQEIL